ncbi:cysteine desulfurase family protein [Bacillus piscicola]|uniref:cysteine desulfurase family protein n=1 Tax=Bacillus piscicola TaxID=1632684 RepID=UPI001F09AF58|nr:cysteine desulfurase family protein [Bacillus piscicola]
MVYLDNSATTQPWDTVMEAYQQASYQYFGNPSSLHRLGTEAETLLRKARESMASLLKIKPEELVFTSGGTEGNNLAIKGTAMKHMNRGKHLVTSTIEHPSVKEAFCQLEAAGFTVTYVPVNREGLVDPDDVLDAIRDDTILVSIIHVNNEIGSVQPIKEIGERLAAYPKLYFHTDHVQGAGLLPLDFKEAKIDLATISGHKFHGLKGTGALYVREGVILSPLFHGGGQERTVRAGTENVPGITAMAKALRLSRERLEYDQTRLITLKNKLINDLEGVEGTVINTSKEHSAPHIINVSFPGLKPEVLIQALTKRQYHVSTKSACSSKLEEPSAVLLALGAKKEQAESAIRISYSIDTTEEEVKGFMNAIKEIVAEIKL